MTPYFCWRALIHLKYYQFTNIKLFTLSNNAMSATLKFRCLWNRVSVIIKEGLPLKQWFVLRLLEIDFWVRVQYFSFGLILKNDCQIDFKSTFNRPSKDFEKWALSFKMIKKFLYSIHFLTTFHPILNLYSDF